MFKNHGASAGASMSHSHNQIMTLPIVTTAVAARLDSIKEYFDETGTVAFVNSNLQRICWLMFQPILFQLYRLLLHFHLRYELFLSITLLISMN